MAPVAGGVPNAQEDRDVPSPRLLEGLGSPLPPVDRIALVLQEIRARRMLKSVGHAPGLTLPPTAAEPRPRDGSERGDPQKGRQRVRKRSTTCSAKGRLSVRQTVERAASVRPMSQGFQQAPTSPGRREPSPQRPGLRVSTPPRNGRVYSPRLERSSGQSPLSSSTIEVRIRRARTAARSALTLK